MHTLVFALQQMLAILAATIAVPAIVGNGLTPATAMFGAGTGTLVYLFFTKMRSPVFLGSSFAFIGSMLAAFAGGVSANLGMLGLIIGALFAGLVYVVISIVVRHTGVDRLHRLTPAVIIGPTVSVIGLSLARNAISDLGHLDATVTEAPSHVAILCGLATLFITMLCSTYGKNKLKMFPFVVGILAGYVISAAFTVIGTIYKIPSLMVIDFSVFKKYMLVDGSFGIQSFVALPDFVFTHALSGVGELSTQYLMTILVAYVPVAFVAVIGAGVSGLLAGISGVVSLLALFAPVAFVVFAEHIADHKNLSSVIHRDLFNDPGLHRTLRGDGVGSFVGALFGGCPNTTYGESIACVAITGHSSPHTIAIAALGCIVFSFVTPFVAFIDSIPTCVMGGVCISLYGFIAVSGLKMLQKVDLDQNRNLFVASIILIAGIGGITISVGAVTLTNIAVALILGIIANAMLSKKG